ncbi:MAG TPA: hypothetical protein VFP17_07670 [Solirubrobacterales bacterium]|nr:hypothetical protein [Solirubrobacterales bacterium]
MRRLQALSLAVFATVSLTLAAGCGEGGAAAGATVTVYAAAPLCKEAARSDGRAGDLLVHVVCLAPVEQGGRADLAAAGAGARRATEDSTAVAYLEAPGPAAPFSQSIVEAANIAWLKTSSGAAAMRRVRSALEGDGSSPRQAVLDEVG